MSTKEDCVATMEKMTSSEELVMKVIWEADEELSLMEIRQRVNDKYRKHWRPQTVSTFLARLVNKGYLRHYRAGRVFYYQILVDFADFQPHHAQKYLSFWHNDNAADFLESLLSERELKPEEIQHICELLNQQCGTQYVVLKGKGVKKCQTAGARKYQVTGANSHQTVGNR